MSRAESASIDSLRVFSLEITLEMIEASQNQWLSCMFFES